MSDAFRRFVLDQLEELGQVTARSMFGGVGLYHRGVFFGIIARDTLYLKVGDANRRDYQRAQMPAFTPYANRSGSMKYYAVPVDVLESVSELAAWARKSIAVASAVLAIVLIAGASLAGAQTPRGDGPWNIEAHVGAAVPHPSASGAVALPAPGATFPSTFNGMATRAVSSWFFGDGAMLLNQAVASFGVAERVAPLDGIAQARFGEPQSGAAFGVRISRSLNKRFAAEFSLDYTAADTIVGSDARARVEATRASFGPLWNRLLTIPPISSNRAVDASTSFQEPRGAEIAASGNLRIDLRDVGRATPYVTAGAGVVSHAGGLPSATVTGEYQFTVVPLVPTTSPGFVIREVDSVALRGAAATRFVTNIGAGVRYGVSRRLGVRFDLREQIGRNSAATLLDATPASGLAQNAVNGSLVFGTSPPLSFATTGSRSNLSGAPLSGFKTYTGSGLDLQLRVSAGLFWRL